MTLALSENPSVTVAGAPSLGEEVSAFLLREAELLDDLKEREWLTEMVSRDIIYQVPIRETVERARGKGFQEKAFHLDENYGSLNTRVARGETKYAWAEDPPSRVRHFITNIRITKPHPDTPDEIAVKSNFLIFRTRVDEVVPHLLAGERKDVLRREDGELRLLKRMVHLDLTAIGTHNFSLFF